MEAGAGRVEEAPFGYQKGCQAKARVLEVSEGLKRNTGTRSCAILSRLQPPHKGVRQQRTVRELLPQILPVQELRWARRLPGGLTRGKKCAFKMSSMV